MAKRFSKSNPFIAINYDALRVQLQKRNVSLVEASKVLGYAPSYLNTCITRNTGLRSGSLKILQDEYAISPEDIVVKEPKVEEQEVPVTQPELPDWFSKEELYQIIYSATYNAMKQALSE